MTNFRVVGVFKTWLDSHFQDFDEIQPLLSAFIESLKDERLKSMLQNILRKKMNPETKHSLKNTRDSVVSMSVNLNITPNNPTPKSTALSRMMRKNPFAYSGAALNITSKDKIDSDTIFGTNVKILDCEAAEVKYK